MKTWWLSFCDPNLPRGRQFKGVIIVDEKDFMLAHQKVCLLGINPGGEIEGYDITHVNHTIKPEYKNRLLSRVQIESLDWKKAGH
jgi:hypothetical protein